MVDKINVIRVWAGISKNGPIYEELPVELIGEGLYLILKSPGLALNVAKNDLISLDGEGKAKIIKRGGNFCIQIYDALNISRKIIDELDKKIITQLSGTLDGCNGGNYAFSIPSKNSLDLINKIFDDFKNKSGIEWYFSNIYTNPDDPEDDTLDEWWLN